MNIVFGSMYFLVITCLLLLLYHEKNVKLVIKNNWKTLLLFLTFNIILMNLILYFHLRQESFIPSWDFGGFYRKSLEFIDKLDRSVIEAWDNLVYSINYTEYNYLAESFLYLPMKMLGNTFLRFVICMFNTFLLPANMLIYLWYLLFKENKKTSIYFDIFIGGIITLFAPNVYSMVQGYIGSAGLFFIIYIMLLVYLNKLEKKNIFYGILIGLLLLLLLLIRRWFAYFIVSFFIIVPIAYILDNEKRNKIGWVLINLFCAGIVALFILIVFINPLFSTITTYNYSEAYSVMKASSIWEVIYSFIETYGILFALLMIFGFVQSNKIKNDKYFVNSCVGIIVLSISLFNQVQRLGSHHYYIVNILCIFLIIYGLYYFYNNLKTKNVAIVLFILLILINYSKTYLLPPAATNSLYDISNLLVGEPLPMVRKTAGNEKIRSLVSRLNNIAGEYDYFYTIASCSLFNEDMLRNAGLPNDLEGLHNLVPTCVYDLRDYLPKDFFYYQYIIVSEPLILQFDESLQRVIQVLGNFMLNDSRVDQYYQLIEDVEITNGIHIKVFKRKDNIPNYIREEISDIFKEYYPDEPRLYEFSMLEE